MFALHPMPYVAAALQFSDRDFRQIIPLRLLKLAQRRFNLADFPSHAVASNNAIQMSARFE
jgi:hypothetical protein